MYTASGDASMVIDCEKVRSLIRVTLLLLPPTARVPVLPGADLVDVDARRAVIQRYWDALMSGDMVTFRSLLAPGAVIHYPGQNHMSGDYTTTAMDPSDDCTMWYTTEYLKANGTFNWSTWIASFKFPGCQ